MWWLALILLVNALVPNGTLYEHLSLSLGAFRVTLIDALLYPAVFMTFLPGWNRSTLPVPQFHPAFRWSLGLAAVALISGAIVGAFNLHPEYAKFYFASMRAFVAAFLSVYMGYQVLRHPAQIRTAVCILLIVSLANASGLLVSGGSKTTVISEAASSNIDSRFDVYRTAMDQAIGDTGRVAASLVVISLVSGIMFLPVWISYGVLVVAAGGMFMVIHRNEWLTSFLTMGYVTFFLWPSSVMRKIGVGLTAAMVVGIFLTLGIVAITEYTGRDFGAWAYDRLESLLPSDDSKVRRAWDTRIPSMLQEAEIWLTNPILGQGFGAQEMNVVETGVNHRGYRHMPWVAVLAETGIIGWAAYAVLIGGMTVVAVRLVRTGTDKWIILLGTAGVAIGVANLLFGWFTLSWLHPRPAMAVGLVAGLVFRCRDLQNAMRPYQGGMMPALAESQR